MSGDSVDTTSTTAPVASTKEANRWGMFVHFGIFAAYIIPVVGLVVPLVLWQINLT